MHKKTSLIFLSFALIFSSLAQAYAIFVPPKAFAATKAASYYMYWKDSDTNALKKIFDHGELYNDIGSKMVIVAKGDIFGDKGRVFTFEGINKQLNTQGGGADDQSDNYYAVTTLYCADNKITSEKPQSSNAGYILQIDYATGFHTENWDDLEKNKSQELYGGVTRVNKLSTVPGTADKETYKRTADYSNATDLDKDDDWGGHGGNPKDHIDPSCWSGLSNGRIGDVKNYYKQDAATKKEIDELLAGSPISTPGGGGEEEKEKEDPCKNSLPVLGWIMCPVIELGITATDTVFKSFIEPMLENVPISTEPGNETYQAWKQFRIIGNIVLIGSLLAVVYAQARGDR